MIEIKTVEAILWFIVLIMVWLLVWPTNSNAVEPPYPECMDCKEGSCEGCLIYKGGK